MIQVNECPCKSCRAIRIHLSLVTPTLIRLSFLLQWYLYTTRVLYSPESTRITDSISTLKSGLAIELLYKRTSIFCVALFFAVMERQDFLCPCILQTLRELQWKAGIKPSFPTIPTLHSPLYYSGIVQRLRKMIFIWMNVFDIIIFSLYLLSSKGDKHQGIVFSAVSALYHIIWSVRPVSLILTLPRGGVLSGAPVEQQRPPLPAGA